MFPVLALLSPLTVLHPMFTLNGWRWLDLAHILRLILAYVGRPFQDLHFTVRDRLLEESTLLLRVLHPATR